MLRLALTVFSVLALVAMRSGAAENALARAPGTGHRAPQPGLNFTIADPALAMIWVAPGSFLMSSTHGAGDDTQVTLTRGYWLGQTEVTQGQWQAVIEAVPLPSFFRGSHRPVEQVAWNLVVDFCRKVSDRERAAGRLPEGFDYTLPTEAQWEFACRAGTKGNHGGEIAAMAWYDANSGGQTHPVAQKKPNAWGFYDMHGNVEEFCADWYRRYPGGSVLDPTGPSSGQFHVIRGGSYFHSAGFCRSAFRSWFPLSNSRAVGFRLALAFQGEPDPTGDSKR